MDQRAGSSVALLCRRFRQCSLKGPSRRRSESDYRYFGVLRNCWKVVIQGFFPTIGALWQAQPIDGDVVKKILGNKAAFSAIVTLEPRRRKFHKPITMTIPIPKSCNTEGPTSEFSGETPTLRLLCSITGQYHRDMNKQRAYKQL